MIDAINEPILSKTDAKRQHYVPRSYLHHFKGEDDKIRVFDLNTLEDYRTSTNNAAVEKHFYDVRVRGVDVPVSPEAWFAEIEANAAPIVNQLVAYPKSIESLATEEQFHLARFITSLLFRTPAFGGGGEMSTYMLGESLGFSNLVLAMPWRIGCVTSQRLYTSDNPVSSYINPVRPWLDLDCFPARDYYLPLSPTLLLKVGRLQYEDNAQVAPNRIGPRCNYDFSEGDAVFVRWLISASATRFLYGEEKGIPKELAEFYLQLLDRLKIALAQKLNELQATLPSSFEMHDTSMKVILNYFADNFSKMPSFAI